VDETHIIDATRRLDDDEISVFFWRSLQLRRLGYGVPESEHLASSRIDIHELERLIANGCPHNTAVRIAA
jgi:hypothetical protein